MQKSLAKIVAVLALLASPVALANQSTAGTTAGGPQVRATVGIVLAQRGDRQPPAIHDQRRRHNYAPPRRWRPPAFRGRPQREFRGRHHRHYRAPPRYWRPHRPPPRRFLRHWFAPRRAF